MPNTAIEENLHGENNFILKIHAKSQCSVLVLEDVEHLTKYINCNLPFISLKYLLGAGLFWINLIAISLGIPQINFQLPTSSLLSYKI